MDKEKRQAEGVEPKFKVGDYAISHHYKHNGKLVKIEDVYDNACWVNDGFMIPIDELEPISATDAFLTELKALMEKYDATIECGGHEDGFDYLRFNMGKCSRFYYQDKETADTYGIILTAQNLMDYES